VRVKIKLGGKVNQGGKGGDEISIWLRRVRVRIESFGSS
jgi:hypothetical protein